MSETLNARLTGNFSATLVNNLSICDVTDVATLSLTETLAPAQRRQGDQFSATSARSWRTARTFSTCTILTANWTP